MALLRKAPLEDRIKDIQAECKAEIEARVQELRKEQYRELPDMMVERGLTGGIVDPVLAWLHMKKEQE